MRPTAGVVSGLAPAGRSPVRRFDPWLLFATTALLCCGLVFVYSATHVRLGREGVDPMLYANRQAMAMAVGLAMAVATALIDYRHYRMLAPLLYGTSVALLAVVLWLGTPINGSRAWLVVGGLQFQPSELAKAALIVMLATLFHERREDALGLRALVEAVVISMVPMALILAQPDFGTFLVFVAIVCVVLLVARVHVRYMVALAVIGLLAIAGAWQLDLVKDYQVDRITAFLSTEDVDPHGVGYNTNQARIAVGSGELVGSGLFRGAQAALGYVPENHTDFIFTVVAEEVGFAGSMVLLGLYGLLLWRGLRIAMGSRDTFGTLLAAGVVAVFAFQVFINIGMTVGLMPVTGLPLPFVSYGGSSLIASLIMIGLLQSVQMRRFS